VILSDACDVTATSTIVDANTPPTTCVLQLGMISSVLNYWL